MGGAHKGGPGRPGEGGPEEKSTLRRGMNPCVFPPSKTRIGPGLPWGNVLKEKKPEGDSFPQSMEKHRPGQGRYFGCVSGREKAMSAIKKGVAKKKGGNSRVRKSKLVLFQEGLLVGRTVGEKGGGPPKGKGTTTVLHPGLSQKGGIASSSIKSSRPSLRAKHD